MAIEALNKKNIIGASQELRILMAEIVGKHSLEESFCNMYTLIINAIPDFKISLSED
jgi:hypothetical protein